MYLMPQSNAKRRNPMSSVTVEHAVYGALASGHENSAQAADVTSALQNAINSSGAFETINNGNMGEDPSVGNTKHFGATIRRDSGAHYHACEDDQTIDFKYRGRPGG
jgi:hypothetical protein